MKYRDKNGVLHDFDLIKGMSAYESAKVGGYIGSETDFYKDLGDLATNESVDSKIDTVNETIDELNQTIVKESRYELLNLPISDGYVNPNGTSASGYFNISVPIIGGEKYKLKTKNGSNIRAYVIKNSSGVVSRAYPADSWGTSHNFDIEIEITEAENNGTMYVCSIESGYLAVQKEVEITSLNTNMIKDNSISVNKVEGLSEMNLSADMFVPKYDDFDITLVDGNYIDKTGAVKSLENSHYTHIEALKGEKYRARVSHGTNLKAYVLMKDNVVKGYYPQTTVSGANLEIVNIDIDDDCDLYVNSYKELEVIKSVGNKVKECDLYGKSAVAFGDSITEGDGSWACLNGIAKRFNMNVYNSGLGGRTYSTSSTQTGLFDTIYNMITKTNVESLKPYDFIILEGGVNDAYQNKPLGTMSDLTDFSTELSIDNFSGAFEMAIRFIVANCDKSKVGYIATHKIKDNPNMINYFNRAKEICEKYSVPYLDLYNESNLCGFMDSHRKYFKEDGCTHPTFEGYKLFINDKVNSWIASL